MKENEQLDMEEVFQLLEEENKVLTKAVSQLFLNLFEYLIGFPCPGGQKKGVGSFAQIC